MKLLKLEQNASAAYEASVIRSSVFGECSSLSVPLPSMCLLCEDMFTTRESTVTGKTTL